MGTDRPLLTYAQVAKRTGFSIWTVRRWVYDGLLTAIKATPTRQGRVRLDPDEVDALLESFRAGKSA